MLGEGNGAEDCINNHDGDAVLPVDNEAGYFYALHDLGKLLEAMLKRSRATIRVRWELADRIWMQRKGGRVVTPHRIDVPFYYLYHLLAHSQRSYHLESHVTGCSEIRRKTDADPSLRITMTSAFFDRGRITAYSSLTPAPGQSRECRGDIPRPPVLQIIPRWQRTIRARKPGWLSGVKQREDLLLIR
jgi:hypothetical protein